ncbi:type I polyketide synthase [Actinokineospora auranticolor]|uniref:Acyl transferase domain-containing protein n=1 Tax=Actinokineospora auranticolor TaxID=155976 RepID=A0A2S6H169_9PSEU|nr:type I polyketide synthase [Actinokineospora auranticolor]PPK71213.1 acyl transferase domain-containing protein [Actinokineospora auranticolor]
MSDAQVGARWRVLGCGPFDMPDPRLAAAVSRGGGLGVLDLGADTAAVLARAAGLADRIGVRVRPGCPLRPADLRGRAGATVEVVLLGPDAPWSVAETAAHLPVLVEVTDLDQARAAVDDGATGVVAVGGEAAGAVGELTSFMLLQRLLRLGAPVWVRGGIGPHTAVGAVAVGAAGVVLDSQLGLFGECDLPPALRARLATADGTETEVRGGRRVLRGTDLPLGEDAYLAAVSVRRHGSAEALVRGLVRDLDTAGVDVDPRAQGEPVRRTLGVAHAVAQGPMTRVSDQPGFALAVADRGAMPYVAVALADGPRTEALLRDTAELLGDRPWGAGILGFVTEDLRAAQLAAIRAVRPHSVLVAGGTPAQAAALEADGIAAYLHVPSPTLLGQYLDQGARRFVFEGSECGGHIGPRTSFGLWEAQLGVLAERADLTGVEVLFAGGVHDEVSAAAVAAMAAPAARRGAGIGVLMGTAYLFTEEAVRHGAITDRYQREVMVAERTVTVRTAPGHETRCLPSPFVDQFEAVAADLTARGVSARDRWQALEELNVGRLRIASKGLRRDGAVLVEVDEDGQVAEGMYMVGQVAVLRDRLTDIEALHRQVTEGAAELLRTGESARTPTRARDREQAPVDIAIVGMSCVFPGADDLGAFWSGVLRGRDDVTEVPPHRWDPAVYFRQGGGEPGTTPSKWGGFLPPVPFDPMSFGIPPASMGSVDPAQLLSLEIARRALADAGYLDRAFDRDRTGVIFGAEAGGDLANANVVRALLPSWLGEVPDEILDQLPALTEDSFPGTLTNVISGRIANRLDLGGANYTVDAACGSSLAALELACRDLAHGGADMVLCGAVDVHNGIADYLMFTSAGALSPTGRCRPFDREGDGIALGEGVACVVLKRLADAERDGDRVYAVVRGVGSASDGRSLGLTAPRPEGQRRALDRAYRMAGISPAAVGLVEAHGTGTVVGDGTELTTLTDFFTTAGAEPGSCALGSVKSQIGHTKCAAGLAGVIKSALSLWFGVIPPTLHLSEPVAAWDRRHSPFTFSTAPRPWLTPRAERVAGVSAFGFGGTNFHAVLTTGPGAPLERHALRDWDCELFLLRSTQAVRDLFELTGGEHSLTDLAVLAAEWPRTEPVRHAIVARDLSELESALRAALDGRPDRALHNADPDADPGKVAFLVPGQGSQRTGMLADLFVAFPDLRAGLSGPAAALAFPPTAFDPDTAAEQDAALRDTRAAQPALGLAATAVAELLDRVGVRPDLLGGHSYGELVALSVAGAFDRDTLLRLSTRRAEAIMTAAGGDPGTMAAVRASADRVAPLLRDWGLDGDVVLANHNAPEQIVLSGPTDRIADAVERLVAEGLSAKRIPVACAFHSAVVAPAAALFAEALADEHVRPPELPVYANRTADAYSSTSDVRAELAAQVAAPVRFVEQVRAMHAAGARTFVEVGPGTVLTGLVGAILADAQHTAVACDPGAPGLRGFLTALARLAAAGVPVDTDWLVRGRARHRAAAAPWTVDGQLVRRADGSIPRGALVPARRITRSLMSPESPAARDPRDEVVAAFLRTNREIVSAQRDVLLGYLGYAGAPAAPAAPAAPVLVAAAPLLEPEPVLAELPAVEHGTNGSNGVNGHHRPVPEPEPEPTASPADVLAAVVEVIAARTGYPPEMIDGDLDLEADLSIDSIKRTEIAGTLIAKLGVDAEGSVHDELHRRRSAQAMAFWLEERLGIIAEEPAPSQDRVVDGVRPRRFLPVTVPAKPIGVAPDLTGKRVRVVHDPDRAEHAAAVRAMAVLHGAVDGEVDDPDTLILLTPLAVADEPVAPRVFAAVRDAVGAGVDSVLVVSPQVDGQAPYHAAGLRGLVRSVLAERPKLFARLVEVAPDIAPGALADVLAVELAEHDGQPVVRHVGADRFGFEVAEAELDDAVPGALGLDRDSVVLVLGGARGITARCSTALAAASGCHLELAGRTPWPPESAPPPELANADEQGLRLALAADGRPLAEVERAVRSILTQREVSATVGQIRAVGGRVDYRSVDVRDAAAVRQLVKDVYARHGRLDGVVYASGILDDKLLLDKDDDSFQRVFATKIDGARALLDGLTEAGVRPAFTVFFGSVSAVFGNRGQVDYAAGNDALETLGTAYAERTGCRVVTVHWGPWVPTGEHGGMVSDALARDLDRRGIGMIDPVAGTECLVRELAAGGRDTRAVVYTAWV